MYLFYAIMILLGVACLAFSMIMLIVERKKTIEISNQLETKKEDIIEAINDAEQIVVEMNNFSDYLFEKIDSKSKEIEELLESSKRKMIEEESIVSADMGQTQDEIVEQLSVVNGNPSGIYPSNVSSSKPFQPGNKQTGKLDLRVEGTQFDISEMLNTTNDKVIHLNPKHRNVYSMFDNGYSEIEIAKMLKLGLGEVKLILGVKR